MNRSILKNIDITFGDTVFSIYHIAPEEDNHSSMPDTIEFFHKHHVYELHYVRKGSATIIFRDCCIYLSEGEAIVIPPSVPHLMIQPKTTDTVLLAVPFYIRKAEGSYSSYSYFSKTIREITNKQMIFRPPDSFYDQYIKLSKDFESNKLKDICYVNTVCSQLIYSLFMSINQFEFATEALSLTSEKQRTSILLDELIGSSASLHSIADILGYSCRHTERLFLKIYGKTFNELKNDRRCETVCRMIENQPDLSLRTISRSVGFSKYGIMERCFQRKYNCTPAEYQNEMQRTRS